QADRLVGGSDAVLVIDDTAIPKKSTHSVGVAAQYASALGKTANCQIADAGARRSAGRTGVAVVSSRELDAQAVSVGSSGVCGRMSNGANETGNGSCGDRSCNRGRCALWLRVGGCRLWAERAVPSGAHSSQTCLGSRYSAAPQGVPCRCADDLASCKARSSPSAARS